MGELMRKLTGKVTDSPDSEEELQIYYAPDLLSIYSTFQAQVHKPRHVLYPSCGYDGSPAKVFERVTFVDSEGGNAGCIQALKAAGYDALQSDIRDYSPTEKHDLLILLNPCIPSEWGARHLERGGWIIANNYHGNASQMFREPESYEFWGAIDFVEKDRRKKDYRVEILRDLEGFFVPVADFAELERLRPDHADFTQKIVESFIRREFVKAEPGANFDEKWAAYRATMKEGMPSRRIAERYIFRKK
jgi:hypothetical protein